MENCIRHIERQVCPVSLCPVFVTSPTHRSFGKNWRFNAITEKLNELREAFLESGASHLWIIDADVEVPPHALDSLLRLDVDVASGVYPTHENRDRIMGGLMDEKGKTFFSYRSRVKGEVLGEDGKFVCAGNGCLLIKRRVFTMGFIDDKPLFFRSKRGVIWNADLQFFIDVQDVGFSARLHTGVLCGHLPESPLKELMKDLNK